METTTQESDREQEKAVSQPAEVLSPEAIQRILALGPYRGIRPYEQEDAEFFFGRNDDARILLNSILQQPLTIYYGESGVGKTSLLLAGVLPILEGRGNPKDISESERKHRISYEHKSLRRTIVVARRKWQDGQFETAIREDLIRTTERVMLRTKASEEFSAQRLLQEVISLQQRKPSSPDLAGITEKECFDRLKGRDECCFSDLVFGCSKLVKGRVVLFFDQFEEYFRYSEGQTERGQFESEIAKIVNDEAENACVVISLREEALAKLDRFKGRIPDLMGNLIRLRDLKPEGIQDAILFPLERFCQLANTRITFEDKVVDYLKTEVDPTKKSEGICKLKDADPTLQRLYAGAPYLQILLWSVWQLCEEEALTISFSDFYNTARAAGFDAKFDNTQPPSKDEFGAWARQIANGYVSNLMKEFAGLLTQKQPVAGSDAPTALTLSDTRSLAALQLLQREGTQRACDCAATVLIYMATIGGAKVAHKPVDLASFSRETPLAKHDSRIIEVDFIESVLNVLGRVFLVKLVEESATCGNSRYELTHDVLGQPLMRWRETYLRQRNVEILQEKYQRWLNWSLWVAGVIAALVGIYTAWSHYVSGLLNKGNDFAIRSQRSEAVQYYEKYKQLAAWSTPWVNAANLDPSTEYERYRRALALQALFEGKDFEKRGMKKEAEDDFAKAKYFDLELYTWFHSEVQTSPPAIPSASSAPAAAPEK